MEISFRKKTINNLPANLYNMVKKAEIARQKLFDGDEEKCLKEVFEIKNQIITLTDLYNNPLRALQKSIDDETYYTVIKEGNFNLINSFNEKYLSEEGLEVYYLIRNELIYLFSYGEYQPGRYMLFLEGLWYYEPWDKEE
ncbi:uncharacterized protein CHSO_3448 [Chryseobacterium sp. StRB126]|nr:uncharacterized protein CHSO_3448 [Chryseobacterium sp. StRB126]